MPVKAGPFLSPTNRTDSPTSETASKSSQHISEMREPRRFSHAGRVWSRLSDSRISEAIIHAEEKSRGLSIAPYGRCFLAVRLVQQQSHIASWESCISTMTAPLWMNFMSLASSGLNGGKQHSRFCPELLRLLTERPGTIGLPVLGTTLYRLQKSWDCVARRFEEVSGANSSEAIPKATVSEQSPHQRATLRTIYSMTFRRFTAPRVESTTPS